MTLLAGNKSKDINFDQFHKIRELVTKKGVIIEYCHIEEKDADIFTKPLKIESFYKIKKMLRMTNSTSLV